MSKEITAKAKAMKREYMRKWRAENKDKVAAINNRYWERKAAAALEAEKADAEQEAEHE